MTALKCSLLQGSADFEQAVVIHSYLESCAYLCGLIFETSMCCQSLFTISFLIASDCICIRGETPKACLAYRRALDMEGWAKDVTLLRRQAAAVDRKLHQMRLVDRLEGGGIRGQSLFAIFSYCMNKQHVLWGS